MLIALNGLLHLNLTKSAKVLYVIKKTKIASFIPLVIKPIVQTNNQKPLSVLNVLHPMHVKLQSASTTMTTTQLADSLPKNAMIPIHAL